MPTALQILLGDTKVGVIQHLADDRTVFMFYPDYLEDKSRPTLSQSFFKSPGELIRDHHSVRVKLMPFFSNLLPEGRLRDILAKKAGIDATREFFLLNALGDDLPGNVRVKPIGDFEAETPAFEDAVKAGGKAPLRFSLAGVQLKFSAIQNTSGGLTVPANGAGGHWILKLPSQQYKNVPENEFSMMSLAKRMGMDVPEIHLVKLSDIQNLPSEVGDMEGKALAVRRFDRGDNGQRIHIEDFAQVYRIRPEDKYDKANNANIAFVLNKVTTVEDVKEFIRRLTFSLLIGNEDMHVKNWSLIYRDGITPALSPAYDFLSVLPYDLDHTMGLNLYNRQSKAYETWSMDGFERFAVKANIPKHLVRKTVVETRDAFMDVWPEFKQMETVEDRVSKAIDDHIRTRVNL